MNDAQKMAAAYSGGTLLGVTVAVVAIRKLRQKLDPTTSRNYYNSPAFKDGNVQNLLSFK